MVFALARPAWEPRGATRFLVAAEAGRLPVAVVLNKADLVPAAQADAVVAEARPPATALLQEVNALTGLLPARKGQP